MSELPFKTSYDVTIVFQFKQSPAYFRFQLLLFFNYLFKNGLGLLLKIETNDESSKCIILVPATPQILHVDIQSKMKNSTHPPGRFFRYYMFYMLDKLNIAHCIQILFDFSVSIKRFSLQFYISLFFHRMNNLISNIVQWDIL